MKNKSSAVSQSFISDRKLFEMPNIMQKIGLWNPITSGSAILEKSIENNRDKLSQLISQFHAKNMVHQQFVHFYNQKDIVDLLSQSNIEIDDVYIVGSSASGLATVSSNLNLIISFVPNKEVDEKSVSKHVLSLLQSQLNKKENMKAVELVSRAVGPQLYFRNSGIFCSVNAYIGNKEPPLQLSSLIMRQYNLYDDRFKDVYMFMINMFHVIVKNHISSTTRYLKKVIPKNYCIGLMVAHAFYKLGLCPNFHGLEYECRDMSQRVRSFPILTSGMVFYLVLDYYVNVTDLSKFTIDMRKGEPIRKNSDCVACLNIIDPNSFENPGKRVCSLSQFQFIMKQVYRSMFRSEWPTYKCASFEDISLNFPFTKLKHHKKAKKDGKKAKQLDEPAVNKEEEKKSPADEQEIDNIQEKENIGNNQVVLIGKTFKALTISIPHQN